MWDDSRSSVTATRPETDQRRAQVPVRSSKAIDVHERMLHASVARSRFLEIR